MAKDYLTKELEKYEKSKKAERLDSNTAVADFDKSENMTVQILSTIIGLRLS